MHYLKKVFWELTKACNASCIHCSFKTSKRPVNELTLSEALRVCDELNELGCEQVTLAGGEFFLSPYWEKICARLVHLGMRVDAMTNGFLLNDTNIRLLKNIGLTDIYVSIDGLGKTHDYIRGIHGLFDKVTSNIAKALAQGFAVGINTSISAVNLHQMDNLHSFLQEIGAWAWQIQVVENRGSTMENPELALKTPQILEVARKVAEYGKLQSPKVVITNNLGFHCYIEPLCSELTTKRCQAGLESIGITAHGEIQGCLSVEGCLKANEGNIKERSLIDIWNDPNCFTIYRTKSVDKLTGFCAKCEYKLTCLAGCSGLAWSLTGAFTENPLCLHKYLHEIGLHQPTLE